MYIGARGGRNLRELRELKELRAQARTENAVPVRVVGLTGGIASGKTVATDALRGAGFTVVDADEVSRELTAKGTPVEKELVKLFPSAADSGALDRRKLRLLIANDALARKRLDAYTHPIIVAEIKKRLGGERAILSAPLLFESALSALCDATVCVVCPRRIRIERLTKRDGMTAADAERMIDAQIPDSMRAPLADFCVPSDTPEDEFRAEIVALFEDIFGI